ncbi:hypothetical protein OPKNFCMD_5277 [Methylobacterium crusticola]|uniref:Uncharacterized protein n=1 Tax=Methylobacterium crusticola TaxID=1697972 RepID=A0ABQ4R5C0_9HYPH|nr:hypothetical protein [Methylobacterium crusticola]GJD52511.1 hypothetical protein OPKNFCMD_5277 [Methylobacterium crusticola]
MQGINLDEPADLTIWCSAPMRVKATEPISFNSLRAALTIAAKVLREPSLSPWIITAGGMILTPMWLADYAAEMP